MLACGENLEGSLPGPSEIVIKEWLGGSHIVMKSTPRVPGDRPLTAIGYRYRSYKVIGFIANEGARITEPDVPYLSHYPDDYSNVSICPVVSTHTISRYLSACNAIDIRKRVRQSDLALEKYWVTQSGYFTLATTVALGMGITDGKLLLCHGISEQSKDKKISTI